ncbi:TonB-dependent receptor plug domain-containing protein [Sulfurimonas sp. RIFCSPLOWO2_12_36_12]|uniref:TonB-dependent receptor plug domain-containing protein n=1 Tax=Sulfurimonas sp. RIFCSPLOWO2_12_36_12 TaxID=1802253 RepID=UPI000B038A6C|nr:TonB-dependent receptor plug domain-containing protein [Sulfurimonas sp. RIFCSPLOWO2_12_36_12]
MKHKISYNSNRFSFILILFIGLTNLSAQTDKLLESISSEMEHFNKVATLTKQNEHYQPYIISVFQGKELEKLGVANLKEALLLVPGVDMATDNSNTQTPIFRGSNPLAYGQSKLFIDGVVVNNLFLDAYSEYLSFPIEMIKRIEVVRGPGSKTDGFNAYAGSINVITYAEDFKDSASNDKLVFKYGSYDYRMGGFFKTYKTEDLKLFVDFFYQEDDKKISSGPDGLSQGIFGANNIALSKSGDAPLWLREYSLGVNLEYKDFSLKARMLEHTQGSAYGINLALPQESDRVKLPSYYLDLGYNKEVGSYEVNINAGVKYDTFDSKSKLLPDDLNISNIIFEDGIYGEHYAAQRTLYQSSYLKYSGINKHTITSGYRLIKEETIDMTSKLSNRATGDVALVDYTYTLPFFDKDAKRDTLIFSMQDEFQFNDDISFIYGFNYEQTSYKDAGLEPRVSMVYQLDTENIFKTIYSRSHRNASWQEMFTMNNRARVGSTDLKPEIVDAFEAAYIKKFSTDSYLQTNLFYLLNKDQIYNSSINPEYRNAVDTDIYGFEVEYKGNISSADQLYLNYSYVDGKSYTQDVGSSDSLPNVAHHLAKGYYIYNLDGDLSLSGVVKYVGSKDRVLGDTREKVKAYSSVDSSLHYKDPKYKYSATFSIKNIFNTNITYPSAPNTYIQDYAQERRTFLVTLKKEF